MNPSCPGTMESISATTNGEKLTERKYHEDQYAYIVNSSSCIYCYSRTICINLEYQYTISSISNRIYTGYVVSSNNPVDILEGYWTKVE